MKLHKGTIYFYSIDDYFNTFNLKEIIKEQTSKLDVKLDIFDVKSAEIGEWNDDISINWRVCPQENYEGLFNKEKQLQILIDKKEELMENICSIDVEISRLRRNNE